MKKVTISIEGMHCASCAVNIEKSLKSVKGVKSASVSLMTNKAIVEADDSVTEKSIKNAVSKVGGYKASSVKFELSGNEQHRKNESHTNHEGHDHSGTIEQHEINFWKKKMFWAWAITIPAMFFMFADRFFGLTLFGENINSAIILLISFPVVFILGWATIKGGFKGVFRFYFNMDLLIAMGTIIAYISGILSFYIPLENYSGVSAMIMTIFITGKFIEVKARGHAGKEIKKLLELGAKKAWLVKGESGIEIDISKIKVDDILLVKPGEKIPTDGTVVYGESLVDESMVTGESRYVNKAKGSNVIGATINQDGILYIQATKVGKDTFLSHIIKLVEEAQGSKVPIQALADKITNIFVPTVLVLSVLTFFGWLYFSRDLSNSLGVAISVLVIACPCALGLATPTALMVGSGVGAKNGILIRKGEAIQTMKEVEIIVLDKTGTITKGKPVVKDIYPHERESYLLDISASIEILSEHPVSKAIVKKANLKQYKRVSEFKVLRGHGLRGVIGSKSIMIGNTSLMEKAGISLTNFKEVVSGFESQGYTCLIIAENGRAIGIIGVADAVKEDSVEAINTLKEKGYKVVMITGDNQTTANAIAKEVGIRDVIANVLPGDKAKKVEALQQYGVVTFVGDGINDAPALKQSNVGIAMGTGTDIAIESGDIVLSKGSLTGVVKAINLSKATFRKIKQNLFWAFAYNIIAIPLAIMGILHPVVAEIAMALSSITVVGNANLLRHKKI